MGAIVIRTRFDEGTESAEVATSDVKTRKRRNVFGIDMNRNNRIDKNVFTFILNSHSQLVIGARDPDMIATLSLSRFNVMT